MSTTKQYFIRFKQLKCADTYDGTNTHVRGYVVDAPNKPVARQIAHAMLVQDVRWPYGAVPLEQLDKLVDADWRVEYVATNRTSSNEYKPDKPSKNAKRKAKRAATVNGAPVSTKCKTRN